MINSYHARSANPSANNEIIQDDLRKHAERIVGGPQEMDSLLEWAGQNLPDHEIDQLSDQMANPMLSAQTVRQLKQRKETSDRFGPRAAGQ